MNTTSHPAKFTPLRAAIAMLVCAAALPAVAQTAAGLAQYTSGKVTVSKGAGPGAALVKGGNIQVGDTITTGDQGRVQMRFSDGGFIALHANSKFSVNGYVDANDADKDQFLVELVSGGMRAITGLIGKRKPANYKVTTPTASIGIRGSGFNLVHNANGTLSVTTELDAIDVCNKGGCLGLNVGESALVKNAQDKPVRTNIPATVAATSVTRQPNEVGNEAEKNGTPSLIAHAIRQAAAPVASYALGISGLRASNATADVRQYFDGAIALDGNGQPASYVAAVSGDTVQNTGEATNLLQSGSAANNDQLILGNWSSSMVRPGPGSNNPATAFAPAAFFAGQRTSDADLASLAGRNATYRFDQATPVLSSTGASGTLLPSSNLTANFSGVNTTVGVNLDVRFATNGATPSTDYALRGNADKVGPGFAGALNVTGGGCGVSATCFAAASGAFIGPNATRAGVSFAASTVRHGDFAGAGGFVRSGITSAAQLPPTGIALPSK